MAWDLAQGMGSDDSGDDSEVDDVVGVPCDGSRPTTEALVTLTNTPSALAAAGAAAAAAAPAPAAGGEGGPPYKVCAICASKSNGVRWFIADRQTLKNGKVISVPLGILCYLCGVASEAWPLEFMGDSGQKKVVEKYFGDLAFRATFDSVRTGATLMETQQLRDKSVTGHQSMGLLVKTWVACVPFSEIEGKTDRDPATLKSFDVYEGPNPDGVRVKAFIFNVEDIPADVDYFMAEAYVDTKRSLNQALLSKTEVLRDGQADDRYSLACTFHMAKQRNGLTASQFHQAPSWDTLLQAIKNQDIERQAQAAARDVSNIVAGGSIVSGSRLEGDAPVTEPPAKKYRGSRGQGVGGVVTPRRPRRSAARVPVASASLASGSPGPIVFSADAGTSSAGGHGTSGLSCRSRTHTL